MDLPIRPLPPPPAPRRTLRWALAGLILLCILPRAHAAWTAAPPCDDGYVYFAWARALIQGDLNTAFSYLNLNIYPAILGALYRTGLDWISAARLWGILAAALTIVPLYRWVRGIAGVKTGLAAALLFAIYPDAIELSIEPIREPTFWLFLFLGLDLTFHAFRTLRLPSFLLAGTALALAAHTRTEGWILIFPALALGVSVAWFQPGKRWQVARGTLAYFAVTPCLLLFVNVTLLHGHPRWEWGRLKPIQVAWDWLDLDNLFENTPAEQPRQLAAIPLPAAAPSPISPTPVAPVAQAATTAVPPQDPSASSPSPPPRALPASIPLAIPPQTVPEGRATRYFKKLLQAFDPLYLVFVCLGLSLALVGRRRIAGIAPIFAMCAAVLLAVWVRLSYFGDMNGRYFLTVVLLLIPFGAAGLRAALSGLPRLIARATRRPRPMPAIAAGLLVILTAVSWIDAVGTVHRGRVKNAVLGEWLRAHYGPFGSVYAAPQTTSVAFYAKGTLPHILIYDASAPLLAQEPEELDSHDADAELVVLSARIWNREQYNYVLKEFARQGWRQVPPDRAPPATEPFVILVRNTAWQTTAN